MDPLATFLGKKEEAEAPEGDSVLLSAQCTAVLNFPFEKKDTFELKFDQNDSLIKFIKAKVKGYVGESVSDESRRCIDLWHKDYIESNSVPVAFKVDSSKESSKSDEIESLISESIVSNILWAHSEVSKDIPPNTVKIDNFFSLSRTSVEMELEDEESLLDASLSRYLPSFSVLSNDNSSEAAVNSDLILEDLAERCESSDDRNVAEDNLKDSESIETLEFDEEDTCIQIDTSTEVLSLAQQEEIASILLLHDPRRYKSLILDLQYANSVDIEESTCSATESEVAEVEVFDGCIN